jgi:hypothetical protein
MSYFFTIAGEPVELGEFSNAELIPAADAQDYVQQHANKSGFAGHGTLFLVHDGSTGTSDELIVASESEVFEGVLPEATTMLKMVRRILSRNTSFRIWWAGGPGEPEHVVRCNSPEEAIDTLIRQLSNIETIGIEHVRGAN